MQKLSIIVQNVIVKTEDKTVLDGISFSLRQNEHLAIIGGSGSGKTTLAKALAGKIHFDGNISFNSDDVTGRHTRIQLIDQRYAFRNLSGTSDFYYQQRYNSFDSQDAPTIYDELEKASVVANNNPDDSKQTNNIDFTRAILGIEHLKNSPLIQLSSGEHKRFQLARALINPPDVLILDTPYTGLDVAGVKELNKILLEISKQRTQIIIIPGTFETPEFVTHACVVENGRIAYFGSKEDLALEQTESTENSYSYNSDLLPLSDLPLQFESVVKMKNIHLNYAKHLIFSGLNWTVNEGEKWLLKGRNGSGKSSLLSMITGDHPQAYANEIYLFGKRRGSGESIWDIKEKTGFISPELHAYFDKNVSCFDAIASGFFDTIGLYRKLSQSQHQIILQWLDFLQISHVSTKPLHSTSTSFQRMILLARALVKNPPLLVL
ncbi:MAG TPA: ATP-binding cassette domain-containing protein, partial [Hanamia sp.]|nr:ATP-binding cassette domain-containing protein [Hanamia sp.]